jgi:hypothetical protein
MRVQILNSSWEAYNKKKAMIGQETSHFSPEELWEFNYLVDVIQALNPILTRSP